MLGPALLAAGGGVLGSVIDAYSQHKTNKSNERIANEANAASAQQAEKQMQFQEEMSSSAYQRSMEDMRKAGLNPILAYSQGGASTPSGAMGDVKAAKLDPVRIGSQLSGSATQAIQLFQQAKRDESTIALQNQQATAATAQTQKAAAEADRTITQTQIDLNREKRNAQIHNDTAAVRQYQQKEAELNKEYLELRNKMKLIREGSSTVEGVSDAAYGLLPSKLLKGLFDRGRSSAGSRGPMRSSDSHWSVDKKTGEIIE